MSYVDRVNEDNKVGENLWYQFNYNTEQLLFYIQSGQIWSVQK